MIKYFPCLVNATEVGDVKDKPVQTSLFFFWSGKTATRLPVEMPEQQLEELSSIQNRKTKYK